MEDEYIITPKNEQLKGPNMLKRLSMFTQILSKENNIHILFKNKSQIKLKEAKSFIKICSLNELYPEENIYFNYILPESQPETPKSKPMPLRAKPPKKKLEEKNLTNEEEKEDDSLTILVKEIKETVQEELIKEGSTIAKNPTIYKVIWRCLYFLLFLFPFIVLLGLSYPMTDEEKKAKGEKVYKKLDSYQIPRLILMVLNFCTSVCGCSKIGTNKRKINFRRENILLSFIILTGILGLAISFCDSEPFIYVFSSLTIELVVLGLLIFVCILLFVLNAMMFDFYKKYQEKVNSAILLVDLK